MKTKMVPRLLHMFSSFLLFYRRFFPLRPGGSAADSYFMAANLSCKFVAPAFNVRSSLRVYNEHSSPATADSRLAQMLELVLAVFFSPLRNFFRHLCTHGSSRLLFASGGVSSFE